MTDREIIKRILSNCMVFVKDCNPKEKVKLANIIYKITDCFLLQEDDIRKTAGLFTEGKYMFHCSDQRYPLEWAVDQEEQDMLLLFSDDLYLLNKLYDNENNNLDSIIKIKDINLEYKKNNKLDLLKQYYET